MINVLEAVKDFEAETGKTVEVIDPRVLLPLDTDKIFASVKKTGRVLVATEAPERGSMTTDFCNYFRKLLLRSQEAC